jgi:hypothetical protein
MAFQSVKYPILHYQKLENPFTGINSSVLESGEVAQILESLITEVIKHGKRPSRLEAKPQAKGEPWHGGFPVNQYANRTIFRFGGTESKITEREQV